VRTIMLACVVLGSGALPLFADDWTRDMGCGGLGWTAEHIDQAMVSAPGGPPIAWRASVGQGGASPVVAGGKVYVVGAFVPGTQPSAAATPASLPGHWDMPSGMARLPANGNPGAPMDAWATCLDATDGRVLWRSRWSEREMLTDIAQLNAAPLLVDGRLFVRSPHSAAALDAATGKVLWVIDIAKDLGGTKTFLSGRAPMVAVDGKVLLSFQGAKTLGKGKDASIDDMREYTGSVVALEPATGTMLWRHDPTPWTNMGQRRTHYNPETNSMESSMAAYEPGVAVGTVDGQETVVLSTGHATIGLDPRTGRRR